VRYIKCNSYRAIEKVEPQVMSLWPYVDGIKIITGPKGADMIENVYCPGCKKFITKVKDNTFYCAHCNCDWTVFPDLETYIFKQDTCIKMTAFEKDDPEKEEKLKDYEAIYGSATKLPKPEPLWKWTDDNN